MPQRKACTWAKGGPIKQTKNQPNGKEKTPEWYKSSKDPNYVVKIEQAIAKKYGEETVQHPKPMD